MQSLTTINLRELYEIDDSLWLEETIKILRENRLQDLDVSHLIEELESLGRNDKARVKSLLEQIIRHILLLQFWREELAYNGNHWQCEIITFRIQLKDRLTTNLANFLGENLEFIYQDSLKYVKQKTKYEVNFPSKCPYTLEQLLNENWFSF
jgi:hypothetical protein